MSSKKKTTATKEDSKPALVPKMRFPEFREEEGWEKRRLEELVDIQSGATPSKANPAFWKGSVPWVSAKDMKRLFLEDAEDHISDAAIDDGARLVPAGTLLMLTRGMTLLKDVPICVLRRAMSFNQDVKGLRPKDGVDGLFLAWMLTGNKDRLLAMVDIAGHGTGKLNTDELKALELVLPSPPEQQKIAECLSSVDELMAAESRKVDALKTHKKGLMQQLFPREGETQPRLRFPEFQNAGEWMEEKLDELLHFQDGFAFKSTDFVKSKEDATQVIRITDINNQNTNEDKVYIPSAFLEANKLGKYGVDDGDLLLSLTGAAGFNFFFWDGGPATINQRTAKVTAKKKVGRALLRLLEPLIHEKINARGEGQNNNLSKEFLSSILLVIPEPAEQQRIADCLTSLDDLIAAQTQKLAALKTHKKALMQQLFPSPEEIES